jgi:CheY-like chemotaxis protein
VAYKIIVADRSLSIQRIIQMALPEPEFRLFPFEDGLEVLDSVAEIKPDAVLLSPSLTGRSGAEVGRLLRARQDFVRVPVILLRGIFESAEADKMAGMEYDAVVQKPFESDKLASAVRALIEKRTCPSTLPEDPPAGTIEDSGNLRAVPGPSSLPLSLPEEPSSTAGLPSLPVPTGLRDWLRREFLGTEREIEKRVRARVLADIKEWLTAEGKGTKGTP